MAKVLNFADFKGGIKMSEITVFDVAKAFLYIEPMSHKKLQKLCYYAQAWYLALYDVALFNQKFAAWIHGPVCPQLYDKYRESGWQNIDKGNEVPEVIMRDERIFSHINEIYRIYGGLSGDQLEYLTHSELPWREARAGLKEYEPSTTFINEDIIKNFYREEFRRSQND